MARAIISMVIEQGFMRKKIEQPYQYSGQFFGRSATSSGLAIDAYLLNHALPQRA